MAFAVFAMMVACSPRTAASDDPEDGEPRASSEDVEPEETTTMSNDAVTISCEARRDDAGVMISVEVVNHRGETIHLLDKRRLPYLLRDEEGTISALYGVNEPDPDVDYYGVEIPLTRPLAAGERFRDEFRLVPLVLHDHFSRGSGETPVEGTVRLRCSLAYGLTPIDKAGRLQMSIKSLMDWQQWVEAPELSIELGP